MSKSFSEMNESERLDWGTEEHNARTRDLAIRSPEGLKAAQDNAEIRRRAVGASKSQAATAVRDAAVARRRAECAAANLATGA